MKGTVHVGVQERDGGQEGQRLLPRQGHSRTVLFPDNTKKTLGIMLPGDYEFSTADKEIMEILSGDLEVLLPGTKKWRPVKGGETFDVPAQSKFSLKVKGVTDYCCSYGG